MKLRLKVILFLLLFEICGTSLAISQEITFFITSDSLCDSNVNDYIFKCQTSYSNSNRFIGSKNQKIVEIGIDTVTNSVIVVGSGNIMSYYAEDLNRNEAGDFFGELLLRPTYNYEPEYELEYVQFYISLTQKEIVITKGYDLGNFTSQCLQFSGYFIK